MVKWIENYSFEPSLIVQRLEQAKSIALDGKVSFSGFEFSENASILTTMLSLNRQIPDVERRAITTKAIFTAAEKDPLTKESILKEALLLEKQYLCQPVQAFRLITNLSTNHNGECRNLNIRGSKISIGCKLSKKAITSRSEILREAQRTISNDLPIQYSTVSVIVHAKSFNEAATKAIDDIDLLRSIWNYLKNRTIETRLSSGKSSPVNRAILGPIHTLHKLNGEIATDSWWYDANYREEIKVWRIENDIPTILKSTKHFLKRLCNIPYQEEVVSILLQYTRALDSTEWNHSFLQLWSTLEQLTGTTQQDSHKVTVKRASFVFSDTEYASQILNHLRFYRNKSIHTGSEIDNIEPLLFQLKRVVEGLINFHIGRPKAFKSMAEAAEFMDSPSNREQLDTKIRKLQAVKKFVSK